MKGDEHPTRTDTAIAGIELALCIKELKRIAICAGTVRVNMHVGIMSAVNYLETLQPEYKK